MIEKDKHSPLLPESLQDSKLVFQGSKFDVRTIDLANKKGKKIKKEFVVHPGAVVILPILDEDRLILIRNERFAIGKTIYELPAGTLEKSESPLETAQRELIEETGYKAAKVEPLTSFYISPGYTNEVMYAFVAEDLVFEGQKLQDGEEITLEPVTFVQALEMIQDDVICDAKTISTLLYYFCYRLI